MDRTAVRRAVAAAGAGAVFLHAAAALRTPLGAASDDALHLLLARNLLAGGFAVPGPGGVPVTDPLPGFPALMALPVALLAPRWGLLRAAPLLAAAAALAPRGAAARLRFAAVAFLPLGAWLLRNTLVSGSATAYAANARDQADLLAAWSTLPAHAWKLVGECLGRGVLGLPPGPLAGFGGLALLAACARGARTLWRRGRERALLVSAGVYLLLLVLLHLAWRPWQSRYAFTFLPFVAVLLPAALEPLLAKRRAATWALVGLLAAPGLSRSFGYAFEGLAAPRVELWPRSAAWLRASVPPEQRVIALEPYLVTLASGREASFPPPAPSREAWVAQLRRRDARWVFLRNREARSYLSKEARDLMRDFDAWAVPEPPFSIAFSDAEEGVVVLRLD
ncbi:MAG: hypothetical protein SF051_03800 [Elusimicrobiota bacterium]|nr:hypothetical protein [Elusimicrobiota bacterium]